MGNTQSFLLFKFLHPDIHIALLGWGDMNVVVRSTSCKTAVIFLNSSSVKARTVFVRRLPCILVAKANTRHSDSPGWLAVCSGSIAPFSIDIHQQSNACNSNDPADDNPLALSSHHAGRYDVSALQYPENPDDGEDTAYDICYPLHTSTRLPFFTFPFPLLNILPAKLI